MKKAEKDARTIELGERLAAARAATAELYEECESLSKLRSAARQRAESAASNEGKLAEALIEHAALPVDDEAVQVDGAAATYVGEGRTLSVRVEEKRA